MAAFSFQSWRLPPLVLEGAARDDRLAVERLGGSASSGSGVAVAALDSAGALASAFGSGAACGASGAAGGAGSWVAACASDARKLSSSAACASISGRESRCEGRAAPRLVSWRLLRVVRMRPPAVRSMPVLVR